MYSKKKIDSSIKGYEFFDFQCFNFFNSCYDSLLFYCARKAKRPMEPGEGITHIQRTMHFQGPTTSPGEVSRKVLHLGLTGISLK
jgi:hypothetical protein